MINCIIYEDNEEMQALYREVIHSFFISKNLKVKFYTFSRYQNGLETKLCNIDGKKIFILDIEVPGKSGLDLARIIRSNGDWLSPMIVITSYEYLKTTSFTSKMLMLDFISKKEDIRNRLEESLVIANHIIPTKNTYTFQYNGKLYHIDYQDIFCFEKDLNDNYTFLHTKLGNYKIKESIATIEKILKKNRLFFKIHRSCIVNIDNIKELDLKTNTLYFENYSTNLLTKENRDILIKQLNSFQIKI